MDEQHQKNYRIHFSSWNVPHSSIATSTVRTAFAQNTSTAINETASKLNETASPAHSGKLKNAIDFVAPENTIVLAAAEGTVTYVKDYSYIGGPSVNFWDYSNFISIKHQNEEYTRYDHLAFGQQ